MIRRQHFKEAERRDGAALLAVNSTPQIAGRGNCRYDHQHNL